MLRKWEKERQLEVGPLNLHELVRSQARTVPTGVKVVANELHVRHDCCLCEDTELHNDTHLVKTNNIYRDYATKATTRSENAHHGNLNELSRKR